MQPFPGSSVRSNHIPQAAEREVRAKSCHHQDRERWDVATRYPPQQKLCRGREVVISCGCVDPSVYDGAGALTMSAPATSVFGAWIRIPVRWAGWSIVLDFPEVYSVASAFRVASWRGFV